MSFKTIAVTTDLSENASAAIPVAAELARKFDATLKLIHVFEDTMYYASAAAAEGIMADTGEWLAGIMADRKTAVRDAAVQISAKEKLDVEPVFLTGNSIDEIVKYTKDNNIDCLVVATHGRTGLPHLLLGSVAERLVRLTPCAVLTVHPKTVKPARPHAKVTATAN
jgi:nucleotide-binding universal stress UspA family protein